MRFVKPTTKAGKMGSFVMEKKSYHKPQLKTLKIGLGVFGDYGDRNDHNHDNRIGPGPIQHLGLRLE